MRCFRPGGVWRDPGSSWDTSPTESAADASAATLLAPRRLMDRPPVAGAVEDEGRAVAAAGVPASGKLRVPWEAWAPWSRMQAAIVMARRRSPDRARRRPPPRWIYT